MAVQLRRGTPNTQGNSALILTSYVAPLTPFEQLISDEAVNAFAGQELHNNSDALSKPIKTTSADLIMVVTSVEDRRYGKQGDTDYKGFIHSIVRRYVNDTHPDASPYFQLPVNVSIMYESKKPALDSQEAKLQYCLSALDMLRRDNEKGGDTVLNVVPDLLKASNVSEWLRAPGGQLESCTLANVPRYPPNNPDTGKGGKKKGKGEGDDANSGYLPFMARDTLFKNVATYLENEDIANSLVHLIHTRASLDRKVHEFRIGDYIKVKRREGPNVPGSGVIAVHEFTYNIGLTPSILLSTTDPATGKRNNGLQPLKTVKYYMYSTHSEEGEFAIDIYYHACVARRLYDDRIPTMDEYIAAQKESALTGGPSKLENLTIHMIPKHRNYTELSKPSGFCLFYDPDLGKAIAPDSKRLISGRPGEETIAFRDYIVGCRWSRQILFDGETDPGTGKFIRAKYALCDAYTSVKLTIYSHHLDALTGLHASHPLDRAVWLLFGAQIFRSSDMIFHGRLNYDETCTMAAKTAQLPRWIKREEAIEFIRAHRVSPTDSTVLACEVGPEEDENRDEVFKTAMQVAQSAYRVNGGSEIVCLADVHVDKILCDMAKIVRECGYPVTKEVALRLIANQHKRLPTGVATTKVAASRVRLVSILREGDTKPVLATTDEKLFDFYALSSKTDASDYKTIPLITVKHTSLAFSPAYIKTHTRDPSEGFDLAKKNGVPEIAKIMAFQPASQTTADYMIYAVRRTTPEEMKEQIEDVMRWIPSDAHDTIKLLDQKEEVPPATSATSTAAPKVEELPDDDADSSSKRITKTDKVSKKEKKRARASAEEGAETWADDVGTTFPPSKRQKVVAAAAPTTTPIAKDEEEDADDPMEVTATQPYHPKQRKQDDRGEAAEEESAEGEEAAEEEEEAEADGTAAATDD